MHIHCPHCGSPIEVVDDQELCDVTCPSCGSSFNLLPEETVTRTAKEHKTLGHFELLDRIGVGAFGEVWTAHDSELDRTVAIKLPRKGRLSAEEAESFLREARSAARLKHPSIVAVHEVGKADDQLFIVSDYVRGVTLADWLTGKRSTPKDAAALVAQLADAVHHAHENGVIHRDLKPSNIMLDDCGKPYIMDFGLAKREAGEITMTMDGRILGTPAYMSPEQAQGAAHDADARSDVYSLGVILFELLTGELPFRGNARMLVHQVINDEPASPRLLNSGIPRDVETICLKCLQKEPRKRFGTARELAEDLRRFIAGAPIRSRPVTRLECCWRWCKRNPYVAGLSAAVALLLLLIAGVSLHSASSSRRERDNADSQALRAATAEELARENAERTRRLLYISDMAVAQSRFERGYMSGVAELLQRHLPKDGEDDLRGFEWYYLWRLCKRGFETGSIPLGARALSVTYSPDASRLVVGRAYGELSIVDLATGVETRRGTRGTDLWNAGAAFSHDGGMVVWVEEKGQKICVNDGHTMNETCRWDVLEFGFARVRTLALSPVDALLVTGHYDGTVVLWSVATRKPVNSWHEHAGEVRSVAFSADGQQVVSGGEDCVVRVWSLDPQKLLAHWDYPKYSSSYEGIWSVAFAEDDQTIVCGGVDRTLWLWSWKSGEKVGLDGHSDEIRCVAVSPSPHEALLASAGRDGTIKLWDLAARKPIGELKGHSGIVQAVAFSPREPSVLASASQDGTVMVWKDIARPDRSSLSSERGLGAVAFMPEEQLLLGYPKLTFDFPQQDWQNHFVVWDLAAQDPQPIATTTRVAVASLALSPTGVIAVAGEQGDVEIFEAVRPRRPGGPFFTPRALLPAHCTGTALDVAFSADGRELAVGTTKGELLVRSGNSLNSLRRLTVPEDMRIFSLCWSLDRDLAVAGSDGKIRVYGAGSSTPSLTRSTSEEPVMAVAFSPDGQLLASGGGDGRIRIWSRTSSEPTMEFASHSVSVRHLVFAENDHTLISVAGDGIARIWDLELKDCRFVFPKHRAALSHVAYNPISRTIAAAGRDGTVQLWQAASDGEVATVSWP